MLCSDTFQLTLIEDENGVARNEPVELNGHDISWNTDRNHKFKNPDGEKNFTSRLRTVLVCLEDILSRNIVTLVRCVLR